MTDILLHHDLDDGEITLVNGDLKLTDGLETAVYLSLFGGNEDDNGSESTLHLQWWGNVIENVPDRKYRSQTGNLLQSLTITSVNLQRIANAIKSDLEWLGKDIDIQVNAVSLNKIQIIIEIEGVVFNYGYNS